MTSVSRRLRQLAFVLAGWHLYIAGAVAYAYPLLRANPGYKFIEAFPGGLIMWIVVFALTGLSSFLALGLRSDMMVRWLGGISAIISAVWALNFGVAFWFDTSGKVSPVGVGLFGLISIIEIYVLSIPTSPVWDDYVERRVVRRAHNRAITDARAK